MKQNEPTPTRKCSYRSRQTYRAVSRKKDRLLLQDIPFEKWLSLILANEKAAQTLIQEFGENLERMQRTPLTWLAALPDVGEAGALKVLGIAFLINWSKRNIDPLNDRMATFRVDDQ
jgi:hypothetical protein